MRPLTAFEEENLKTLVEYNIDYSIIQPTSTALEKGIMDATFTVRNFLKEKKYHDYSDQSTGAKENGVIKQSIVFFDTQDSYETKCSMYRPKAKGKGGDPRIWFYGLHNKVEANVILVLVTLNSDILYVINISTIDLNEVLNSNKLSQLKEILLAISHDANVIVNELLEKLRTIANKGFIKSLVNADTGVGRTLEKLLGIEMNSSKSPDYKGIELKSFREKKGTRKGLFAKTPNWELSKFKSRVEILDAFGYWEKGVFRLYNTIRSTGRNAQGLILDIKYEKDWLVENSDRPEIGDFLVWELEVLRSSLMKKHRETFWISTESKTIENNEYFQYKMVEHTKDPRVNQFETLIETGAITVDYPIKRTPEGKVVDKGCNFKLKASCLDLLFPPSEVYNLLA